MCAPAAIGRESVPSDTRPERETCQPSVERESPQRNVAACRPHVVHEARGRFDRAPAISLAQTETLPGARKLCGSSLRTPLEPQALDLASDDATTKPLPRPLLNS